MSKEGFYQEPVVEQMIAEYPNKLFVRAFENICRGYEITVKGEKTFEIQPMVSVLEEPQKRVLTIPYRRLNPFFLLAETLWLLAGEKRAEFITFFNPRLNDFLDHDIYRFSDGSTGKQFHGAYGARIFRHRGVFDQMEQCVRRLKADPNSRQAVITIWDPGKDNTKIKTKDTPCNIAISFKIRGGKLNMSVFNRSNDFIWGYCSTNVVQFSVLQEVLAGYLGVEIGKYVQYSDSMHVYASNPYYRAYNQPNSKVKSAANNHHVWGKYDIYKSVNLLPIDPKNMKDFNDDVKATYDYVSKIILGEGVVPRHRNTNEYLKLTKEALEAWTLLRGNNPLNAIKVVDGMVLCDWKVEIIRYMYTDLMRKGWEQGSAVDALKIEQLPIGAATYAMHDDGAALL